jgi:hypothetical protein
VIHLFLFDVDGVLVDARGYLKALQDTVSHFSRRMGLGELPPAEEEVRVFEANGIASEWDSGSICVGALLVERLRQEPLSLPPHWPEALALLAANPRPLSRPDYAALARTVGARLEDGVGPAEVARQVLGEMALETSGLEPILPAVEALLKDLLGNARDPLRGPVTRVFQELVVGSGSAERDDDSADSLPYLELYDRPLLAPQVLERLRASAERVMPALYTLRPSLPPVEIDSRPPFYSPEAELARSLVGADAWPLIGLGRMEWLARRSGEKLEQLIKPSPVQALAAIGAAWSGQETTSLEAALALHRDGGLVPPLADLPQTTVHVFEDSPGGLRAVVRAVGLLREAGLGVEERLFGVAAPVSSKAEALTAEGGLTYPSVDEAVAAALDGLSDPQD